MNLSLIRNVLIILQFTVKQILLEYNLPVDCCG